MKTLKKIALFTAIVFCGNLTFGQSDSLGLPGDNLDLQAVLSIFKNSSSVEEFEKKLNSASDKVNNLDLNGDGQVDYLRVVESGEKDFRSIVIQDPISKTESQDVAVIEIEKRDEKTAHIQIVGDESLYGKDYIIEPRNQSKSKSSNDDAYASSSEKSQQNSKDDYSNSSSGGSNVTVVNVWGWPAVSYIYGPSYAFWVSPWYWGYYPGWYSPWAPYGYYYYHRGWYGYNYGFYGYRTNIYAFPHVHHYYYGRRVSSGYVQKTAPTYQRRQAVTSDPNRTRINRSNNGANGTNRVNDNRRREQQTTPANRGGSEKVRSGENRGTRNKPSGNTRVNRGNSESQRVNSGSEKVKRGGNPGNNKVQQSPANRSSGGTQRGGGNPGGSNRSGGGGGNRGGGGGGHPSGGGGGHRK